jgi:hypothetical protein
MIPRHAPHCRETDRNPSPDELTGIARQIGGAGSFGGDSGD